METCQSNIVFVLKLGIAPMTVKHTGRLIVWLFPATGVKYRRTDPRCDGSGIRVVLGLVVGVPSRSGGCEDGVPPCLPERMGASVVLPSQCIDA